MIVYDKEQKQIVIPNGIGNIDIYNVGYVQGETDMVAKARVIEITENGNYMSKYSDPILPAVTGVYADGTEFYGYAELNGKVFNTKIAATVDSRLEFWYKGDNNVSEIYDIIIGAADDKRDNSFQIRYISDKNDALWVEMDDSQMEVYNWDDTIWHHLIVSKAEGLWIDGKKHKGEFLRTTTINGEFYINGAAYDRFHRRTANGSFGMIKIDDTVIIPTADGFLNTNTGELLEVVKDGSYTFAENTIIYGEGELYKTINVNVPDLNGSYDEGYKQGHTEGYGEGYGEGKRVGYEQGKTDGVNEQKGKLESIVLTENGTYSKEDGYNHIEVNVPDLNGSYDEGFNAGEQQGFGTGYEQGQADVAANARVLEVTENGNYLSKFSDPILPTTVTGVYADDTEFYSYALISNIIYSTGIIPNQNTRLEFWFKPYGTEYEDWEIIIGSQRADDSSDSFQVRRYATNRNNFVAEIGTSEVSFTMSENKWYHIIMSVADGFVLDGTKIGDFTKNMTDSNTPLQIGGSINFNDQRTEEGYYGMIKIDDTIIIPTENGFKNVTTDQILQILKDGSYTYTENLPIYAEGELYKTINVNVQPKVNVKEAGLRLGYSTFTKVPESFDFNGITNMGNMFYYCIFLKTIPLIDTSNVTDMSYMFYNCAQLQTIPLLDTSNVKNMEYMFGYCNLKTIPLFNTSNVTNMYAMFYGCEKIQTIPQIDTSNVTKMDSMFTSCTSLVSIPALNAQSLSISQYSGIFGYASLSKLTDFGGFLNLKCSLDNDYSFKSLPNLTYESCINVLNGLYDFTGNGETPNSNQGKLKVHQNFLDKVGDEISIGVAKGWSITA